MDWFAATCGGAALYAAGKWLHIRLQARKGLRRVKEGSRQGIPLKVVVANCEAKWFLQELQLAMSGEHAAMVRVSHMLLAGYGTRQDEAAAANWMRKAWAVQNFKEPADPYLQYELLDFKNSDIPVLNDPQEQQQQQQVGPRPLSHSAAAAAGAHAAAHLQQRQRRRRSKPQAAEAAGTKAAALLEPYIRSPAALDGSYSSSSSGSSGVQAGGTSNSPAGRVGFAQSSAASMPTSRAASRQASHQCCATVADPLQQQQQGCVHSQSQVQVQQAQAQAAAQLVQHVTAVDNAIVQAGMQAQQQPVPMQQWPVQVQVSAATQPTYLKAGSLSVSQAEQQQKLSVTISSKPIVCGSLQHC